MSSNSTYSRVIGTNPHADWFLGHLGIPKKDFGRFRDVALYNDNGTYIVRVLTRNFGSGRQFKSKNDKLAKNVFYIRQEIEPHDNTYMYFLFKMPDSMIEELRVGGVDLAVAEASLDSWLIDNRGLKKKYEDVEEETEDLEEIQTTDL